MKLRGQVGVYFTKRRRYGTPATQSFLDATPKKPPIVRSSSGKPGV
jgi:hypothetical protein